MGSSRHAQIEPTEDWTQLPLCFSWHPRLGFIKPPELDLPGLYGALRALHFCQVDRMVLNRLPAALVVVVLASPPTALTPYPTRLLTWLSPPPLVGSCWAIC